MEKLTPLQKAVTEYIERDASRFHMPGHKGLMLRRGNDHALFGEAYRYDITEVWGADSLYEAKGAILETEQTFARVYGAHRSLLSAGGATLCIQTMLALVAAEGAKIIAGRNAHISAVNAMALLGLMPTWVYPDSSAGCGIGGRILPEDIAAALEQNSDVRAVYITSPDYFGIISDVAAIARICHAHGVPLLVDNAHGAHLKFQSPSLHPMDLGADMCSDSLHKTMPVLTGGALLHLAGDRFAARAKACMALFGSTSPSYLILLSCDRLLAYLEHGEAENEYDGVRGHIAQLEELAAAKGFVPLTGVRDHTKLVLSVYNWGMTGEKFGSLLREWGVEPELVNDMWAVLMASPENFGGDYRRVQKFLTAWELPAIHMPVPERFERPEQVLTLREAVLSPSRALPVEECENEVAASMVCPCPPGVPLVMPGELLSSAALKLLKISGNQQINVVL